MIDYNIVITAKRIRPGIGNIPNRFEALTSVYLNRSGLEDLQHDLGFTPKVHSSPFDVDVIVKLDGTIYYQWSCISLKNL